VADEDLYSLLGVGPGATAQVIRAAYRALARAMHPDLGGDPQRMAALNAAWSVLRDPIRRQEYDARRGYRNHNASVAVNQRPGRSHHLAHDRSTVLDFGRYAGSSIKSLARSDPDYLEWLARTQIGRPLRREIDDALGERQGVGDGQRSKPRRFGAFGPQRDDGALRTGSRR
jgi:curved DNA-binding protein CbpA